MPGREPASSGVTPEVAKARLASRMERQRRVLASVRSLILLLDELALYFEVGRGGAGPG